MHFSFKQCTMMNKNKIILITGGAGYIGSVLVAKLLFFGYKVRVLDNLSFSGQSLLSFWQHPHFEFMHGDIRNADDVDRATIHIETIVHLAAIVGDPACQKKPDEAKEINKVGSELLCMAALTHNVKRFIFASTCSNYGRMPDHNGFVDERTTLNPISLYAELKVGFEEFLLEKKTSSFTPVCLRFSTAYGMSPRPRFDLTVNEFTKELFFERKLEIYGEQFWRPYCHTTDLANACLKVIEADSSIIAGEAFNVGDNNQNYQKKKIVELITEKLPDKKHNIVFVKKDEDPRDYRVNFNKIHTTLNYEISQNVPSGIAEFIHAFQTGVITDPDDKKYQNL